MSRSAARHAIIIGGGASGVLLAYQLLHNPASDFRVTLIERRPDIGRGLAYHTGNPEHLLNVRVANMSALPDEPDHFWRWLSMRGSDAPLCADPYCFVSRRIYGDYIASLIEPLMSNGRATHHLSIVQGETCRRQRELNRRRLSRWATVGATWVMWQFSPPGMTTLSPRSTC